MFSKSAQFYDAIYSHKDYGAEAAKIQMLIQAHKRTNGTRLLDVACGTGAHMVHLQADYQVAGLDLDAGLLDIARAKLPDVPLHHADMIDFDLGAQFDAVICLFSAIGYVETVDNLNRAVAAMSKHVAAGGVLMIEPSFNPDTFKSGHLGAIFVDDPQLKIVRMNISTIENGLAILNFRYMVGTPDGIKIFEERHALGLFTRDEYRAAFESAGLTDIVFDEYGVDGRGLWMGVQG